MLSHMVLFLSGVAFAWPLLEELPWWLQTPKEASGHLHTLMPWWLRTPKEASCHRRTHALHCQGLSQLHCRMTEGLPMMTSLT